jgi:hypothetical protein
MVNPLIYKVPSHSNRSITYSVNFSSLLNRWVCNCPNWINRRMKEGTDCKHIKELLSRLDEEEVKNMVQKKRRPQKNQIRTWPPAYDDIGSLALQIFKDYPEEHKKIGINRPSRKVAIDYMRVRLAYNTVYKLAPQTPENNYFLKIAEEGGIN